MSSEGKSCLFSSVFLKNGSVGSFETLQRLLMNISLVFIRMSICLSVSDILRRLLMDIIISILPRLYEFVKFRGTL